MLQKLLGLFQTTSNKQSLQLRTIVLLLVMSSFQVLFASPVKSGPITVGKTLLPNNYSPLDYANIVTGQVTNSKGESLVGVSVTVKGTTTGTTTDGKGNYSIDVPAKGTLVFSFVGFATKEMSVNGRGTVDLVLNESAAELEQVVVVGYGTQKKATVTGAVSQIQGSEIAQTPTDNVTRNLQGRLPGLIINDRGGEPGSPNLNILVRGQQTFGNNGPLVIIDGVPSNP